MNVNLGQVMRKKISKHSKRTISNRLFNAFIFLNSSYKKVQEVYLESQFWEEPSVFAFLVSFFKNGTDLIAGLLLLHGVFQDLLVNVVLVEADVNTVASGHQVVVVDNLENKEKLWRNQIGNITRKKILTFLYKRWLLSKSCV